MKHIGFACAAFALGLLGSPLAAQDMAQATPQAEQLPPPPPFPPMPSSRPSHRTVSLGGHHSSRIRPKASQTRHVSPAKRSAKHHATSSKSVKSSKSHKAASRRPAHKEKAMHFSTKTIRQCHAMTYRQIMRNSSCRTMIKQELAAAPVKKHSTSHKASGKHKATTRSKTKSHSTTKKRRR